LRRFFGLVSIAQLGCVALVPRGRVSREIVLENLMKKPAKNSGAKAPGSQVLVALLAEAEKHLALARKKARLAKASFKHARKEFKQAKKAAKEARKNAKAAIKAAKPKPQKSRKKAKATHANKPKVLAQGPPPR